MDARLAALLDKQDILDALSRFSRGMDRLDRELYLSAYHEDAEMAAGPFVGLASECADWAFPMHEEGQILTHHALLNTTIDLDGDTAHTETYYLFVARNKDESLVQAGGRYINRFERRAKDGQGGAWKIALQTNVIEWAGLLPAIPIPFADVPDLYGNGAPARDRSDPSYRRPLTNLRTRNIP
ncbi:nuclear transport factor 2 family protein [Novosphingobium sp. JCM 18896]|uniref:nuclear transport factor 2 family protein n=1 Tax=Novosphingobium sp. JCM 18896 TaxID=2989731 RepID=UPI00222258E2|nr:nuclear transport factor 2 family protein [Novosphingobium sp. JCM 18896]MCW1429751.1 nuclear transport factor 2 family protein [Novosphingobium sp. JCM 18896]